MSYITLSDLVARFGADEIAQVSDRGTPQRVTPALLSLAIGGDPLLHHAAEDVAAAGAAVQAIGVAIADAQSLVDGYLRARYATPITPVPPVVARLCGDLARLYLHGDRASESVRKAAGDALARLREIGEGKVRFGEASAPPTHAGLLLSDASPSVWSRQARGL